MTRAFLAAFSAAYLLGLGFAATSAHAQSATTSFDISAVPQTDSGGFTVTSLTWTTGTGDTNSSMSGGIGTLTDIFNGATATASASSTGISASVNGSITVAGDSLSASASFIEQYSLAPGASVTFTVPYDAQISGSSLLNGGELLVALDANLQATSPNGFVNQAFVFEASTDQEKNDVFSDTITNTTGSTFDGFLRVNLVADESASDTAPVPLPAAGWLLFSGIGGLAALTRRRKAP
jgi:hypothetical protein